MMPCVGQKVQAASNVAVHRHEGDCRPARFFVLRTPLLPFHELLRPGLEPALSFSASAEQFEEAFRAELARERANVKILLGRPEIWEAIFVANPEFARFEDLWAEDPESRKGRRAELTIVRYLTRMAGRATPFGLFAGISLGTMGFTTCLHTLGREKYQRLTSLSFECATTLVEEWCRDAELRKHLLYRPNSSLYRVRGYIRYVETSPEGGKQSYRLVGVREIRHLRQTLQHARGGATSRALVKNLVAGGIPHKTAGEFVEKLIEYQILRPEFEVPVTGQPTIRYLTSHLPRSKRFAKVRSSLGRVAARLAAIDRSGFAGAHAPYQEVVATLAKLTSQPVHPRPFQTMLLKPAPDAKLGQDVLTEIMRGIDILHHLPQNDRPHDPDQSFYFQEFAARYGRREVPLVEALDDDTGISHEEHPKDAEAVAPESRKAEQSRSLVLLQKFSEALASHAHEISLNEQDLESLKSPNSLPLPESFALKAAVAAASDEHLARGEFRVIVEGVLGSSGAALFARFCEFDKALSRKVAEYLKEEEAREPNAVFAEIVHLPGAGLGDIVFRPVLRRYEFPYLGKSGVPMSRQLPITDLLLSVQGERFRLRSRSLDREVMVRMTNAHNFAGSQLRIYKFLCSIQQQGVAGRLWWDWGALADAPFLPRVASGRLILCRARWKIDGKEIAEFSRHSGAGQFRLVQEWRERRRIPRWVATLNDDQNLPVDLCSPLSVMSFVHLLKQNGQGVVQELFPAPDHLAARGPEGSFVHDLLLPFLVGPRTAPIQSREPSASARRATAAARTRSFPPLSEWVYVKFYTGAAAADLLLHERIRLLIAKSHREGLIVRWFFLRYSDPDAHLRLRFQMPSRGSVTRFLDVLQKEIDFLTRTARVWRVQFDTYEREIERYGGSRGTRLAEEIFHADSQAVLAIISALERGDGGLADRWRLALRGVDLLLADFGYERKDQHRLIELARRKFAEKVTVVDSTPLLRSLQFRNERRDLESMFEADVSKKMPVLPAPMVSSLRVLRDRSLRLAPIVCQLEALQQAGELSVRLDDLALSFIHMHLNRLLRFGTFPGESEIYDTLARLYKSVRAKSA